MAEKKQGLQVDAIQKYQYPVEVHNEVITNDNYVLTMHRIPHGINNTNIGEPILLLASIFDCDEAFLHLEPSKSLGFLLADRGYDVWMLNPRSTSYSRRHKTLNPDTDVTFWNFTLTELSYDVMGGIDYIRRTTGYQQVFLLGFSQGVTVQLIMFAEHPEYNDKVKMMVAFAPAVYLENPSNVFVKLMVWFRNAIKDTCRLLGMNELHPGRDLFRQIGPTLCSPYLAGSVCKIIIQTIAGFNPEQLELKTIPNIVRNIPEGVGLLQLHHYLQLHVNDLFQKYDYGSPTENERVYNNTTPPAYNLENVKVPIAMYYSGKDNWVNMNGVLRLASELSTVVVDSYKVENYLFTHDDFIWAKDVLPLLYNRVLSKMEEYRI